MVFLDSLNDATNLFFDGLLPYLLLAGILAYDVYYFITKRRDAIKKNDHSLGQVIFTTTLLLLEEVLAFFIFWWLPLALAGWLNSAWIVPALRWVEFAGLVLLATWFLSKNHGEKRGIYAAAWHLAVLFGGWWVDRWLGILLISLPLLATYYFTIYHLSNILLPTSYPPDLPATTSKEEDKERLAEHRKRSRGEVRQRFLVFLSYAIGLQLPFVVAGHAWAKPETRIDGNLASPLHFPGLVWTRSHQVVGITDGSRFKRVDGPGAVYTGKLERPFQIIDLRLQTRTEMTDIISKDGVKYQALVLAVFRIDADIWDEKTNEDLKKRNPLFDQARELDHTESRYPFSYARVRAAMTTTSTVASEPASILFWDQWTTAVVQEATRSVLSQRRLDEMWSPKSDENYTNALDDIAKEITNIALPILREKGILLIAAKVINFQFSAEGKELDEFTRRQLQSWSAEWEQKRTNMISEAQAEAERMEQEARVYAKTQFMGSIAEGLKQTKDLHPDLPPRYVISVRFLNSLQEFMDKSQPEAQTEEQHSKLASLQAYIREQQGPFMPTDENRRP